VAATNSASYRTPRPPKVGGCYAVSNFDNDRASGRLGNCAACQQVLYFVAMEETDALTARRIASIESVMKDCIRHMKMEHDMAAELEKEFAERMSDDAIKKLVAGHRGVADLWRVQVEAYRVQIEKLRSKR